MTISAALARSRPVSPAEVAHYQQHGWAKLDGFVDQATVAALLALARSKMGEARSAFSPINGSWVSTSRPLPG
jgi:hypothetical protein